MHVVKEYSNMATAKTNSNLPKSGASAKKNDADYSRDHIKSGPQTADRYNKPAK
jgi:hypothetical protein